MSDIIPPRKNIDVSPVTTFIPPEIPKTKKQFKFPKFKFHKLKLFFWVFLVIFSYVAISVVFAEMKVEITPKSFSVALDEVVGLSFKSSPGKIVFSEISFSDKRNGTFVSSQKKSLESRARGEVTVFNKNSGSQVLVAGTRFESPSGKIYKIEKSIILPVNGSLDVEVIAESPGEEFNEENLIDFTLPGFKEQHSPKFKTVYGKSKTEIIGGFSGVNFIVGSDDIKNAKNILLKDALSETGQTLLRKTPEDSFFLAQSLRYDVVEERSEPKVGQAGEKFVLNVTGSASGVIVNKKALEKVLGKKIPDYDSSSFHFKINNFDKLSFEILDFKPGKTDFSLKVSGVAEFIGDIDNGKIQEGVFDKKLKKSSEVLELFPAVSRVKVHFRPFWLRSFPDTKERIRVSVN